MELWLHFLPQVKGSRPDSQAWKYECGWLVLMTMLGTALLYGIVDVAELARLGQWLGSAILGSIGWFVGDMVHQYLALRQSQQEER